MSKRNTLISVVAGMAGVAIVGTLAYAFSRRAQSVARVASADAQPASSPPRLRESMVVPRRAVPDPLEIDLDLDGVFRAPEEDESAEATVQCDVKVPPLAGADDAEPASPDDLGAYWLTRATQSEHSFSESELVVDLENIADPSEDAGQDEYEYENAELAVTGRLRRA